MIRYVITAIKKNGQRELAFARNHINTYETKERAQEQLNAVIENNSSDKVEQLVGTKLQVRPVECYPGGDPTTCYFEN